MYDLLLSLLGILEKKKKQSSNSLTHKILCKLKVFATPLILVVCIFENV